MTKRSSSYPAYTINESISMVKQIYTQYGDSTYLTRVDVAGILGLSTPSVNIRVSSCVQYNLLDVKVKEGYKPTELFKKIYKPLHEEEVINSKVEAFGCPKLYKKLIVKFAGNHLPKKNALANLLTRDYGIADKAADKAADVFFKNIEDLNILENNILNLDSAKEIKEDETEKGLSENTNNIERNTNANVKFTDEKKVAKYDSTSYESRIIPIYLTNDKVAELHIPKDLNDKDIEIIKAQMTVVELYVTHNKK
jgi:hypothetical protein